MELYTTPQDDTYLLNWRQWYTIPRDENKSFRVVVMSTREAQYWTVTYTILVGYIFVALVALAADITLAFFPLRNSGTRHVMLASFRNYNSPVITMVPRYLMWLYKGLFRVRNGEKTITDWKTIKASLFFIIFAMFFYTAELASQLLLGGDVLQRFQRAPANPNKIFYPSIPNADDPDYLRIFDALRRIRGAGIYQAIGRSEIAKVALSKRITTEYREWDKGTSTNLEYIYSYNMTGFEMGLRDAPALVYSVSGHCTSNYSISSLYVDGTSDIYPFFGNRSYEAEVNSFAE